MDKTKTIHMGELFVGSGGLSLGFVLAQPQIGVYFKSLFAIDNDIAALTTYRQNMRWLNEHAPFLMPSLPHTYLRDIEKLNIHALQRLHHLAPGELDLLIGGPPCQGFSTANRQSKSQSKIERNRMVKVFLDRVGQIRPKMFLMENVQGVNWTAPTPDMMPEHTGVLNVRDYLSWKAVKLEYRIWQGVLNAVEYGVPQQRMRFILFGVHRDYAFTDEAVNLTPYLDELKVQQQVTVGDAIEDLPPLENGEWWQGQTYTPEMTPYVQQLRELMSTQELFDHDTTRHAQYVIERFHGIPEGGNWESIRNQMTNYSVIANTHSNIYRRLNRNQPAITISHYRKSMIIHPTQHRGLSFREACRLQSFPDWFRFYGGRDHRQQQLANAVPPLLSKALGISIARCWCELWTQREESEAADPQYPPSQLCLPISIDA